MAFYRKAKLNKGTKKNPQYVWFPRAILVGKQISAKDLSKRISAESTVSETDVMAVLTSLPGVMGMFMGLGRSVKLPGIGTFQYTIGCKGTVVDSADKVSARQITDVRVRFQPERTFSSGRTSMTRAMAENVNEIEWIDIDSLTATDEGTPSGGGDTPTPDPTPDPSGGDDTPSGGDTGTMTITQVNGVNKSNGGNTAIAVGQSLTITGTDMTGTWKLDGNVDPSSATASEVVFASTNFAEEGNHTVSFNGSNVFTVSVVEDQ